MTFSEYVGFRLIDRCIVYDVFSIFLGCELGVDVGYIKCKDSVPCGVADIKSLYFKVFVIGSIVVCSCGCNEYSRRRNDFFGNAPFVDKAGNSCDYLELIIEDNYRSGVCALIGNVDELLVVNTEVCWIFECNSEEFLGNDLVRNLCMRRFHILSVYVVCICGVRDDCANGHTSEHKYKTYDKEQYSF